MRQPTTSRRARAGPSPARRTTARGAALAARMDCGGGRVFATEPPASAGSPPASSGRAPRRRARDRRAVRAPQPHPQRRERKPRGGQPGVRPRSCPPSRAPGPRKQWRRCGDSRARPRGGGPPQPRDSGAALARRRNPLPAASTIRCRDPRANSRAPRLPAGADAPSASPRDLGGVSLQLVHDLAVADETARRGLPGVRAAVLATLALRPRCCGRRGASPERPRLFLGPAARTRQLTAGAARRRA